MKTTPELLQALKALNLPPGKYAVFGSGPIRVRGFGDPHDLDVIVTGDVFDNFVGKPGWKLKPCNDEEYLEKEGVELWKTWGPGDWDIEDLIQRSEEIDGLPFVCLEDVYKWKKIGNREKDQEDLAYLKSYFAKHEA